MPNPCWIFIFFLIYTIFQEGDTFGMKAILACGPLNIKHMKNKLYTYVQIANTNSAHCLSCRYYLKYETIICSLACAVYGETENTGSKCVDQLSQKKKIK